jgi:guanine deaminase
MQTTAPQARAYRASLFHTLNNPAHCPLDQCYEYYQDGLLLVDEAGTITAMGDAKTLLTTLDESIEVTHYPNHLITPGFVDTHIHYPQTEMIASYAEQLLDWLDTYTFPFESQFGDYQHAHQVATFFLNELLKNGTTTALVFGTVHPESVDAFFDAAFQNNLRMIAGKVMMDRHAPDYLTDTAETGYDESKALIERWHQKGRLAYAVTPRFAPTSTPEQLDACAKLLSETEGLYLHTHLAENQDECDWVSALFPEQRSYLDVYDHHKLLTERSVFAHGIYLDDYDCKRLHQEGSSIAFCPTSNLFLGSGLIDMNKLDDHKVNVGMGTDVGGGTSFSMLQTLQDGYKVSQLKRQRINPIKAFYLATRAGAKSLRLEDKIGTLETGTEADFIVIDLAATELIDRRIQRASNIEDILFALMMLGDDRCIKATYSLGHCVYSRP